MLKYKKGSLKTKFRDDILRNKNSLETEGDVHSVPCLECSDKYYGETMKFRNISICRMYPGLKDAMLHMYRHMLKKNQSIDWKNASYVFNDKNE